MVVVVSETKEESVDPLNKDGQQSPRSSGVIKLQQVVDSVVKE